MSGIIERPILRSVRLQTFNLATDAFFLGYSRLGVGALGNGSESLEDQWTDWTPNIVQITTGQGGSQDGIAVRNDTGVLTARLRGVSISTGFPVFITGQPIRLQHISGLGIATTIYTGRILDVIAGITLDGIGKITPVIELNAVDNYVNHDQTTRYGAMPPTGSETFKQRIARLTQTATAPIEQPTLETDAILGRTVYESSLANHFTLACNTVGAMWWVDGHGVTRFAAREYDQTAPIIFLGLQPPIRPADALHYIRPTASGGSAGFFNRAKMHNHGAAIDPDSGDWVADDRDVTTINLGGATFGFSDAEIDTNHADLNAHDAPILFYRWLVPGMSFGAKATSITWNAQEDLERIPDMQIGRSVYLPTDYLDRDPWPWNVTIGIRHTITPTRWMVELTLIGVANP